MRTKAPPLPELRCRLIAVPHTSVRMTNAAGSKLAVGLVYAENLDTSIWDDYLENRLESVLLNRVGELNAGEDAIRKSARDMLRNGRYKPTGRGKPASEYLVRAAGQGTFPRINPLVDICNLISLDSLLPISILDMDRADTDHLIVRLGVEGESYVFNSAGQEIGLEDLVIGCRVTPARPDGEPIVNPVKDSMATKTHDATTRVASLVYAPESSVDYLADVCESYGRCLERLGDSLVGWAIARSNSTVEL